MIVPGQRRNDYNADAAVFWLDSRMSATHMRIADAAALLGVSPDTVRRRIAANGIAVVEVAGIQRVAAEDVARLAQDGSAPTPAAVPGAGSISARNRLRGIVTKVVRDGVMAQVDVQCGPYRMVSLISREAADELELVPGSVVVTTVKATNVGIEATL